jgi:hypothetical protein
MSLETHSGECVMVNLHKGNIMKQKTKDARRTFRATTQNFLAACTKRCMPRSLEGVGIGIVCLPAGDPLTITMVDGLWSRDSYEFIARFNSTKVRQASTEPEVASFTLVQVEGKEYRELCTICLTCWREHVDVSATYAGATYVRGGPIIPKFEDLDAFIKSFYHILGFTALMKTVFGRFVTPTHRIVFKPVNGKMVDKKVLEPV